MPEDQMPLTLQQAVKRSGRSEKTLRRWIVSGKLVARKLGDKAADPYLISPKDLDAATGNETTEEWQLQEQIYRLDSRVVMMEATVEELQYQLQDQSRLIEELKRKPPASPPAKKTTTTRRKTSATRVKLPDEYGRLTDANRKTLQVELWLRVENNNKYVRGKTNCCVNFCENDRFYALFSDTENLPFL